MLVSNFLSYVLIALYETRFCTFCSWKPCQNQIKFNVNVRLNLDDDYILQKLLPRLSVRRA